MQGPSNIFQWYNIIFVGPAFLAFFWLAYSIFTGVGHDADGGYDNDGESAHDHDGDDQEQSEGSNTGALDFLHLKNRCPKTLGFSILFLTWGSLGYVINTAILKMPGVMFLPAFIANVVVVLFIAVMAVRISAPLIARSLPSDDFNYPTSVDLLGKRGKVSTLMSIEHGGNVVIDIGGGAPLIKKACLVEGYNGPTLNRDTEVLIVELRGEILICAPVAEI